MNSQIQYNYSTDALAHVSGFTTSAVSCDIRNKGNGRLDLCLIHSSAPCTAAGVFTTNDVRAAPVRYCESLLKDQSAAYHAIIANSGNANACTGRQGEIDTKKMATSPNAVKSFVPSQFSLGQPFPIWVRGV